MSRWALQEMCIRDRYEIEAPLVAKKAQPGQFIILRVDEKGERIPITINNYDREKGTVTIIVQTVGATTAKLKELREGECLQDFVGPLGKATETEGKKKVCVVGGGVGCAIAYPVLKKFHDDGAEVHAVVGFKNKDQGFESPILHHKPDGKYAVRFFLL